MLTDDVKELLNTGVFEIISTPLCLKLIKTYSTLYACGAHVRGCEASQKTYYKQLQINGLEMAQQYEEVQVRTCIPAWSGLKYISATAKHWIGEMISDKDAMYLLTNGFVKENSFTKLPNEYLETVCKKSVEQNTESVEKTVTKNKNKR